MSKCIYCISMFITIATFGQLPVGQFKEKNIVIGKPISFILSYKHPKNQNIFFPTDPKLFEPFVLKNIIPITTFTQNGISTDSVVYEVTSFDVNQIQFLSLPVYTLNSKDCTAVFSVPDTVFCKQTIVSELSKIQPKSGMRFLKLPQIIDFPRATIGLFVLLIGFGFLYLLFGRTIRRYIRLFYLWSSHRDFEKSFDKLTLGTLNEDKIAGALVLWKKHLQMLEKRPFSSFTTKEINTRIQNPDLAEALRDIDTAIYGGVLGIKTPQAMLQLKSIAGEFYRNRWNKLSEELKNKRS